MIACATATRVLGNSNGLFHRPRPSPHAPSRPPAGALALGERVSPRATGSHPPPRQRWASPAGHRQAAGRLTRRSSLVLGERQQAATAWGRGEKIVALVVFGTLVWFTQFQNAQYRSGAIHWDAMSK